MRSAAAFRDYLRDAGVPPFLAAIVALFALGVALRVGHLFDVIRIDESITYFLFASKSWGEAVTGYVVPNNHPLNTVLVKSATMLCGSVEWALRLPNLIAGVGTMALTALLARRWYGRVAAVAALAIVAISPPAIHYSVLARGYGLAVFFGLITLLAVEKRLSGPRPRAWAVTAALAAGCALYALPAAIMFVAPVAAYDFALTGRKKPRALRTWGAVWLGAAAITTLFYTPVIVVNGWQQFFANEYNAVRPFSEMTQYMRLYGRSLAEAKTLGIGGPWLWGPLFGAGVAAGVIRRKEYGLLLLFCALAISGFFVRGTPMPTRIFFYLLPLLALGTGALFELVSTKLPLAGRAGARGGAAAAVLVATGLGVWGEAAHLVDDSLRSGVAAEAPALAAALSELPPVTRIVPGTWYYDTTVHFYLNKMGAPTEALDRSPPQAFTFDAYILVPPHLTPQEVANAYFWEPLPVVSRELVREVEGIGIWKAVLVNPK